jgi:probable F420-dependent oxidoreductase
VIATEVACVLETDESAAREIAREYAKGYLARRNYTTNLQRLGYDEDEFKDGGSDRLIDAVIPHGSAEQIADTVRQHLDAGADHVCLQPLGPHPADDYKALAEALL